MARPAAAYHAHVSVTDGDTWPRARVQIQVVLYHSERWLSQLVAGLRHLTPVDGGFTVAFWDNHPGTGSGAVPEVVADAAFTSVWLPSSRGNIGFGAAHNALAARAGPGCEYLLLLNPDAVPQYDCLERLVAAAELNTTAALIEAAQFPIEHPKAYDPATLETNWCSAACLLVRRAAFEELGGFDEALFLYCEDVDLGWRSWLSGWRCIYVPSARCLHVTEDQDLAKDRSAELLHSAVGHLRLRRKYFGEEAAVEYREELRQHLAPSAVEEILALFDGLPPTTVARRQDPHIVLQPEGIYAATRW